MIRDFLAIVGAGTLLAAVWFVVMLALASKPKRVVGELDGLKVIVVPGAQDCGVKVPVGEWLPGLTLYVGMGGKEGRA